MYPIVINPRKVIGTIHIDKKRIKWLENEYSLDCIREFLLCDDGAIRPK